MFTSTVYMFYGFTLMLMQRHNEVQCQSHGTGMARISGWGGKSRVVLEGILWKAYEQSEGCYCAYRPAITIRQLEKFPILFPTITQVMFSLLMNLFVFISVYNHYISSRLTVTYLQNLNLNMTVERSVSQCHKHQANVHLPSVSPFN